MYNMPKMFSDARRELMPKSSTKNIPQEIIDKIRPTYLDPKQFKYQIYSVTDALLKTKNGKNPTKLVFKGETLNKIRKQLPKIVDSNIDIYSLTAEDIEKLIYRTQKSIELTGENEIYINSQPVKIKDFIKDPITGESKGEVQIKPQEFPHPHEIKVQIGSAKLNDKIKQVTYASTTKQVIKSIDNNIIKLTFIIPDDQSKGGSCTIDVNIRDAKNITELIQFEKAIDALTNGEPISINGNLLTKDYKITNADGIRDTLNLYKKIFSIQKEFDGFNVSMQDNFTEQDINKIDTIYQSVVKKSFNVFEPNSSNCNLTMHKVKLDKSKDKLIGKNITVALLPPSSSIKISGKDLGDLSTLQIYYQYHADKFEGNNLKVSATKKSKVLVKVYKTRPQNVNDAMQKIVAEYENKGD
ncbi:hypothetical protein EFP95_03260 [Lentilactobacillus hilgardii]|nr:hypothetical protein [Lentilactobacillus hilgardii]